MADKVLNIKTGKLENCTVGAGCQRHAHNLKGLNDDLIKTLANSFESGDADFPPLYHGSNFLIENGMVEPALQGEGSYEGQTVAFATSDYEEALFFGKYVYLVSPANDTSEGWANTFYTEEGFPIVKLMNEVEKKAESTKSFTIQDKKDPNSDEENARKLWLYVGDKTDYSPAWLEYHFDPIGVVYIDYLKSNQEGEGHAKALLDFIYDKYKSSNIDWGQILHPAASYLYNKYSEKHGRSYSWEDWEDDSSW
jgi:hypothetical protein